VKQRWPPPFLWLLALYPPVALLAANIQQVDPVQALRATVVCLVAMLLLHLFIGLVAPAPGAAVLTATVWLIFFTYGHVYTALQASEIGGTLVGRHRYLIPVALLVLGGGTLLARRLRRPGGWGTALTLMAASALLLPALTIARFQTRLLARPRPSLPILTQAATSGRRPDVYLILLDGYTRQDVLGQSFGVDNQPFLDQLRSLGFIVPDCSVSNYSQTELTLATAFNFAYLEDLPVQLASEGNDRTSLFFLIRHSALRQTLEAAGYRTVAFESGYAWSEWQDADIYLRPKLAGLDLTRLFGRLNAFEALMLETTALPILSDTQVAMLGLTGDLETGPLTVHRERVAHILDQLPNVPAMSDEPKLVFAHIVAPHRPFIFRPEAGSPLLDTYLIPGFEMNASPGYIAGYRNQVMYLNGIVPDILAHILDESKAPPLIYLFGDHGPDDAVGAERMAILQALYLPGLTPTDNLAGLTPINAIRLLLDQGLGYALPPLPNQSYYSDYDLPYQLSPIEDGCRP